MVIVMVVRRQRGRRRSFTIIVVGLVVESITYNIDKNKSPKDPEEIELVKQPPRSEKREVYDKEKGKFYLALCSIM